MRELTAGRGEADLVPGRLRLYRTWRIHEPSGFPGDTVTVTSPRQNTYTFALNEPQLLASAWQMPWSVEMTAECILVGDDDDLPPHAGIEAPVADCSCGIYGWYDPMDTRIVLAPVIGVVEASGQCVLGSNGARAQRARLVAVAPTPWYPAAVVPDLVRARLFDRLRVEGEVAVFDSYAALVLEYPPVDVRELAGEPRPLGRQLDAQQRLAQMRMPSTSATYAAQMEQLRQAAAQAGQAMAQAFARLTPAAVAAVAPPRMPWHVRHGLRAPLYVAGGLFAWGVFDALTSRWAGAISCAFWTTWNVVFYVTGKAFPWQWLRGRGRRRA